MPIILIDANIIIQTILKPKVIMEMKHYFGYVICNIYVHIDIYKNGLTHVLHACLIWWFLTMCNTTNIGFIEKMHHAYYIITKVTN
jgi:hypothetical protein